MKKALLIIVIIFCSAQLYSAEPLVKFYLQDGNTKQYNLSEIENLNFFKSNLSFEMRIHSDDTKLIYKYDIRKIEKIQFDVDIIRISIGNGIEDYKIKNIDSIIFVWNTCQEIQIGTQVWMCHNLDVDHYRNGDSIPEVRDSVQWANLETGAWCYFNNDPMFYSKYGKLYNWYAVNDPRGLAPEGWHVPTDEEWTTLTTYLGNQIMAGGKMKETGISHWQSPNTGATNESGFSALPGGYRNFNGTFSNIGNFGNWWSSLEYNTSRSRAWNRGMYFDNAIVSRSNYGTVNGFSVRCVRDSI